MPNDDKNLESAIASVDYIKQNLVAGVSSNEEYIQYLKAETLFLLLVLQDWQDQNCMNQKQVNWLENYNTYDLSGYSTLQISQFKQQRQLAFQQYLDSLPPGSYPRYKIVLFDLKEQKPGTAMYDPIAYLCPVARFIPPGRRGPNGSLNPPSPQPPQ